MGIHCRIILLTAVSLAWGNGVAQAGALCVPKVIPVREKSDPATWDYIKEQYKWVRPDLDGGIDVLASELVIGGEPKILFVYSEGRSQCGTAGCGMTEYKVEGASFRILGATPGVNRPVYLSNESICDYPDITYTTHEDGEPDVVISYNGSIYKKSKKTPEQTAKQVLLFGKNDQLKHLITP